MSNLPLEAAVDAGNEQVAADLLACCNYVLTMAADNAWLCLQDLTDFQLLGLTAFYFYADCCLAGSRQERSAALQQAGSMLDAYFGICAQLGIAAAGLRCVAAIKRGDLACSRDQKLQQAREHKRLLVLLRSQPVSRSDLLLAADAWCCVSAERARLIACEAALIAGSREAAPQKQPPANNLPFARPFVIVANRQAAVFRPGHSLPTMSIDEYLAQQLQAGGILPSAAQPASKQADCEDDLAGYDAVAVYEQRSFDLFKDDNRRGSGNSFGRA